MRPDRIVVGEVRGAETLDMLLALNSGAAGMTSVHANSAREALRKLTTLPLLAGDNLDRRFVAATVAACVDLVVFCRRVDGVAPDHRDRQRRRAGDRRRRAHDRHGVRGCGRDAAMDRRVPDRDRPVRRGRRRSAGSCSDECAAPVRPRARRVPRVRRVHTDARDRGHACASDRFARWLASGGLAHVRPLQFVARQRRARARRRRAGARGDRVHAASPWSRRWRPRRRRSRYYRVPQPLAPSAAAPCLARRHRAPRRRGPDRRHAAGGARRGRRPRPDRCSGPSSAALVSDHRVTGDLVGALERMGARVADPIADRVVQTLVLAHRVGGRELGRVLRTLVGVRA